MTDVGPLREGAGWILFCDFNQVLVFQRRDLPEVWQPPQGGLDEGESFWTAAYRELEEETGLRAFDVFPVQVIGPYVYRIPDHVRARKPKRYGDTVGQRQSWILAVVNAEPDQIDLAKTDGTFTAMKSIPLAELGHNAPEFKRGLYAGIIIDAQPLMSMWQGWKAAIGNP